MKLNFLLALALVAPAMQAEVTEGGEWLAKVHDFGAFDEEVGTAYCDFEMVNRGPEPIAILSARANCGCTRPEYSTAPIAPGDTAVVRVGFDPKGRPGKFRKEIVVDCSGAPLRTRLTITGTVIGSGNTLRGRYPVEAGGGVRMRTTTIPFGSVVKGHASGQYIESYNGGTDTIVPRVVYSPRYVNVLVEPKRVAPGEQFIISAMIHPESTKEWGVVTDSILILPTGAQGEKPVKVETVAIITEDFGRLSERERLEAPVIDTSETAVDLGRISRTDKPLRRSFEIRNKGKRPLIIRRLSSSDPSVEVKMKQTTVKPGKGSKVEVTVDPSRVAHPELLNARITIIANDPDHPTTLVRVVGEMI